MIRCGLFCFLCHLMLFFSCTVERVLMDFSTTSSWHKLLEGLPTPFVLVTSSLSVLSAYQLGSVQSTSPPARPIYFRRKVHIIFILSQLIRILVFITYRPCGPFCETPLEWMSHGINSSLFSFHSMDFFNSERKHAFLFWHRTSSPLANFLFLFVWFQGFGSNWKLFKVWWNYEI